MNGFVGHVELARIEARQHSYFFAAIRREVNYDLFAQRKRPRKSLHGREVRVLHNYGRVKNAPRMIVKIAANHLTKFRPIEVSIIPGMGAYEALAIVANEGKQVFLLLGR